MNFSKEAKVMIKWIVAISLVACILSLIYFSVTGGSSGPFVLGVLLGGVSSIVKVYLLDKAVDKVLDASKDQGRKLMRNNYFLRLGVSAGALLLGALVEGISLWGVVIGVLAYQLSIRPIKGNFEKEGKEALDKELKSD